MDDKQAFAAGRDDLIDFCILTNPNYEDTWHLDIIADELQDIEQKVMEGSDKQVFLLLEVPPRHGKSELASINFPAWFLGRNPSKEIITASYAQDLSQDFGLKTRSLVQSEEYKLIFPKTMLREDSKSKAKWVTEKGGSYTSVGVGGALTGRGANILLIDDPIKNREDAESDVMRDKVWEWFRSTAYSRLEPNGAVIIIMQRWHKYDLIGKIKEEYGPRTDIELKQIRFPAIATRDEDLRKVGGALWPERYDSSALNSIRKTIGEMNWASQYQQTPILSEHQEFKAEYFRYFEEDDIKDKQLEYTTTIDLATSDKAAKRGDDTVITTIGKERDRPEWYIVDIVGGRLDPLQTCDALFYIHKKYRPRSFLIETNAYQMTFKFWLEEEMRKREIYMPIDTVNHNTKKEERIRGLIPLYKTGVIFHRRNQITLESQLLNFPQGEHDDYPDGLAMQLETIYNTERVRQEENLMPQSYMFKRY